MKILLTGFEPNDDGLNASEILIRSLKTNPTPEIVDALDSLRFEVMPGNTNQLEISLHKLFQQHSPDICILTGQSDRNKITIERIATNIRNFRTPDRAGHVPKHQKICENGPAAYWTTLNNLDSLVSVLESNNIPAAISNYGGTHLCNQILYLALHFASTRSLNMPAGFIHIPVLPEQVIKERPLFPFMPLEMTRQALSLIIKEVIRAAKGESNSAHL